VTAFSGKIADMKSAAALCPIAASTPPLRAAENEDGGHPDPSAWAPLFADPGEAAFTGLRGKHAGAPVWFRSVRTKELP